MADATIAARDRIDRALSTLERKINDLKAAPAVPDDDLFALPPPPSVGAFGDADRIAALQAAGRDASAALAAAAAAIRDILAEQDAG